MPTSRNRARAVAAAAAALSTLALTVGAAQGVAAHPSEAAQTSAGHTSHLHKLLSPAQKYYGVYVSQAPSSLAPVDTVTQETGKQPNMSLFYEDWGAGAASGVSNIQTSSVENACNDGMLPMLTWESWDTSDTGPNGVNVTQHAFKPTKITAGKYDAYITASADRIKGLTCPIALRLDQEDNGDWYPWGVNTPGMSTSASDYVAMYRHVWKIFHHEGVDNVLWVWSPNIQSHKHKNLPKLSKSYPGKKYVDWVGIDGYEYNDPNERFHELFQPTIDQIKTFAGDKPWIIAECGVGTGSTKPKQLKNMVKAVARRKKFNGLNYFDTDKPGNASDWLLNETPSSLKAFSKAIANPVFGSGTPGEVPGD
jgi:hypothetical protein